MKKLLYLLLPLFLLAGCSDSDDDDIIVPPPQFAVTDTYTISLSGTQQVPVVDSAATAPATVELDTDSMQFRASVDLSDIDNVTAVHIYAGDLGFNGEAAYEFTAADAGIYRIAETEISADLMAELQKGGWYINVQTTAYPDGEIRGQIVDEDTLVITLALSGQQEVPAVATSASGYAYVAVDQSDYALTVTARTTGLEDAEMAHIHTGRVGRNGDVLVTLDAADEDDVWVLAADTVMDETTFDLLMDGGLYINVHTPANPSGELRGQILPDNFVLTTFALSGAQEVPMVDTEASGDGYALVNTDNYQLEVVAVTRGVDAATMTHIHSGRVGTNGDVLIELVQSDEPGTWLTAEDTQIDADIFAALASGGHYVNVHTSEHPDGELRGQIVSDQQYALYTFTLSGEQQVPVVATTASGYGYALVSLTDYHLQMQILTSGVADATAAHIHTGAAGENGPVLLGLQQDADDVNRWMAPADAALTAELFDVLAAGGHYVNVHTPAFEDGEIRGQIE